MTTGQGRSCIGKVLGPLRQIPPKGRGTSPGGQSLRHGDHYLHRQLRKTANSKGKRKTTDNWGHTNTIGWNRPENYRLSAQILPAGCRVVSLHKREKQKNKLDTYSKQQKAKGAGHSRGDPHWRMPKITIKERKKTTAKKKPHNSRHVTYWHAERKKR